MGSTRLLIALAGMTLAAAAAAQPAAKTRLDAAGDPLPPQALYRFGTSRFCTQTEVVSLTVSQDAKLLAAADRDGRFYVWDADTGKERFVSRPESGSRVAISPDSRWLAMGDGGPFQVRNLLKDEAPRLVVEGGAGAFAFSRDSKMLALVMADESDVLLLDIENEKRIRRFAGLQGAATSVALSPDGKLLAVSSVIMDEMEMTSLRITIWDALKGDKLKEIDEDGKNIRNLNFLPDNKTLVAQVNVRLMAWDAKTGDKKEKLSRLVGSSYALDGKAKTIATTDGPKVSDFVSGKALHEFDAPTLIRHLAMSGDGKLMAACAMRFESASPRIMLWDLAADKERATPDAHRHYVDAVAFSHDGKSIATASNIEGIARVWSLADNKLLHTLKLDSLAAKRSGGPRSRRTLTDGLAFAADRPELFVAGQRWDLKTGQPIPLKADEDFAFEQTNSYRAVLTPDARLAASFLNGHALLFWDPAKAATIQRLEPAGKKSYGEWSSVAFHPGGKVAVTGKWFFPRKEDDEMPLEDSIHVWDLAAGKSIKAFRRSRTPVVRLMLSPDGETLAVIGFPTRLELWHLPTGRMLREMYLADIENLPRTVSMPTIAFAPHGQWIAFAHEENKIVLIETQTGKEIQTFEGHRGYVTGLAFAADSRRLLSGGRDTSALLWSVMPEDPPLPAAWDDLDRLWLSLGGPPGPAYRVVFALLAHPKKAIKVFVNRLEPDAGAAEKEIVELVKNLASPQFKERDVAIRRLKQIGVRAFPALEKALKDSPNLETTRRIQELLKTVETSLTPETLRDLRALQVLELIGTPDARRLLSYVASGDGAAAKTSLARSALARMTK